MLTTCLSVAMIAALAVVVNADTRGGGYISLPSASKLSARCSSHATSLLTCYSCGVVYGRNTWIVNKKLSANSGRNILMIAASSRTTTCTTVVEELFCTGTRSSKQPPRSESTSLSLDAPTSRVLLYTSRVLLYNVTRHLVRNLACDAIISVALSFARRAV